MLSRCVRYANHGYAIHADAIQRCPLCGPFYEINVWGRTSILNAFNKGSHSDSSSGHSVRLESLATRRRAIVDLEEWSGSNGELENGERWNMQVGRALKVLPAVLVAVLAVSCSDSGSNVRNSPANSPGSQTTPTSANANKPVGTPSATVDPSGGTIEVTSTPEGAAVLLIRQDEGSSGNPERKGSTPVSITGVAPGKYSIILEKLGFRYFQKDIEVKAGKTVKVAGNLKHG